MGRWLRRVSMAVLLAIFFCSAGYIMFVRHQYAASGRLYEEASAGYTLPAADEGQEGADTAPVTVDFAGLRAVNGDVAGWIFCEDTPINYPVVRGEDNDYYLHHTYDGGFSASGSIFVEASNRADFMDANTILYGHHMKNGSMFASLQRWSDQEYYEEHPVMWLLTPEQDYKIVLFSAYTTSAYSDTYTIFSEPGEEMDNYLAYCLGQSDLHADVELDRAAHYILLSTCAYAFDDARDVLHGMLIPVESAGGIPF